MSKAKTTKAQRDKIKDTIKDWPEDRAKVFNDLLTDVEQAEKQLAGLVDAVEGTDDALIKTRKESAQDYLGYD